MTEGKKYYIHNPDKNWTNKDLKDIEKEFNSLGFFETKEAAIGEGAGGAGWEVVIEVVLTLSAIASLVEQIWRIVKYLNSKKPIHDVPKPQETYRVVFHTQHGRISINLKEPAEVLDVAINKNLFVSLHEGKMYVLYNDGEDWNGY